MNFHLTNNPGTASKLVFTTEPSTNQNIAAGSSISVQVAVEDTYGNPESADNTTTVTLGIDSNPGSGTLTCAGGDTSTVSAGVATFSCSINKVGNGYTLSATSSPAHGTVVSNGFNIVAGAPASITVVSGSNQSATQGTAFANPLVAMVTDAEDNPVPGASVTFTAPSSGASGTFSNSSNTIIGTTGSNGQVSEVLTANDTGAVYYSVTASVVPVSSPATFVDLLNGGNFTVNGPASVPPLLPGKSEPLDVVITNPNPESITIGADAITGSVSSILNGDANGSLAACNISWFSISPGPGGASITIPAGATESLSDLSVPQADWPVLSMTDVADEPGQLRGRHPQPRLRRDCERIMMRRSRLLIRRWPSSCSWVSAARPSRTSLLPEMELALRPTGTATTVTVQAVASGSPSSTLLPGGSADLIVQVQNPGSLTVTITGISQNGPATPVGGSGCTSSNDGVTVPTQTGLSISVAPGTQVLHFAGAASMASSSASGCQGASFDIPVTSDGASAMSARTPGQAAPSQPSRPHNGVRRHLRGRGGCSTCIRLLGRFSRLRRRQLLGGAGGHPSGGLDSHRRDHAFSRTATRSGSPSTRQRRRPAAGRSRAM